MSRRGSRDQRRASVEKQSAGSGLGEALEGDGISAARLQSYRNVLWQVKQGTMTPQQARRAMGFGPPQADAWLLLAFVELGLMLAAIVLLLVRASPLAGLVTLGAGWVALGAGTVARVAGRRRR